MDKDKKIVTRRDFLVAGGAVVAADALSLTACTPKSATAKLTVVGMDPKPEPTVERKPLAPRLDKLNGKTIYIINNNFSGGEVLGPVMADWFAKNMPQVKTVFKDKKGTFGNDDPALWQEIKAKASAMIIEFGG